MLLARIFGFQVTLELLRIPRSLVGHGWNGLVRVVLPVLCGDLGLLKLIDFGLDLVDLLLSFAGLLGLSTSPEFGAKVLFLNLDLVVGVPYVVPLNHGDCRVHSETVRAGKQASAKHAESRVELLPLGELLCDNTLSLENSAIEDFFYWRLLLEFDLRYVLLDISDLGLL